MARLNIQKIDSGRRGMDTMKITGFTDAELAELKSMEHYESKEVLLDMLDTRNGKIGTMWHNGNGIYGLWYDNEAAYLNIGSNSD